MGVVDLFVVGVSVTLFGVFTVVLVGLFVPASFLFCLFRYLVLGCTFALVILHPRWIVYGVGVGLFAPLGWLLFGVGGLVNSVVYVI